MDALLQPSFVWLNQRMLQEDGANLTDQQFLETIVLYMHCLNYALFMCLFSHWYFGCAPNMPPRFMQVLFRMTSCFLFNLLCFTEVVWTRWYGQEPVGKLFLRYIS